MEAATAIGFPLSGRADVERLDWADPEPFLAEQSAGGPFRWVLGSDIVYHQQHDFAHLRSLAALLAALLAACPATRVVLGYQERDSEARLRFWDALRFEGLAVREQGLEQLAAEGVDTAGLGGAPRVLWWVEAMPDGGGAARR